ncbi:hypothetical protein CSC17_0406 [Klebsiella oxytoca]|nr:hypothetical protein CSC17_0406 [Klebsiella oxytoca]
MRSASISCFSSIELMPFEYMSVIYSETMFSLYAFDFW